MSLIFFSTVSNTLFLDFDIFLLHIDGKIACTVARPLADNPFQCRMMTINGEIACFAYIETGGVKESKRDLI